MKLLTLNYLAHFRSFSHVYMLVNIIIMFTIADGKTDEAIVSSLGLQVQVSVFTCYSGSFFLNSVLALYQLDF